MGTEYELKFRADAAVIDRIRGDFPGNWREIPMKTTYYDTPGGDLSARKWTLRHRMEGSTHICTLKTPAGGIARRETEVECADILEAIPLLAERSGLQELQGLTAAGVIPVCGAEFVRLAQTMDMEGCVGELALDRGVLRNGSRELPFAEVEAELKEGERLNLNIFGAILAKTYHLEKEPRSKYLRARLLGQEETHGI